MQFDYSNIKSDKGELISKINDVHEIDAYKKYYK